jgi:hypothetical protein
MSSVGVLIEKKNLSVFVREEKKKSKCPKKNFQSVKKGEKCKCEFSGVRKKNERKIPEKKVKIFVTVKS